MESVLLSCPIRRLFINSDAKICIDGFNDDYRSEHQYGYEIWTWPKKPCCSMLWLLVKELNNVMISRELFIISLFSRNFWLNSNSLTLQFGGSDKTFQFGDKNKPQRNTINALHVTNTVWVPCLLSNSNCFQETFNWTL